MQGLAAPLVAQKLLGSTGEYAVLFLILMAVMSTGSDTIPMILQKLNVINACRTQVSRGDRRGLHHHLRRVPGLRVPLQAGAGAWPVYPVRRLAPAPTP